MHRMPVPQFVPKLKLEYDLSQGDKVGSYNFKKTDKQKGKEINKGLGI